MQDNNNFKVGTILDVEYRDSQYKFLFNNTEVNVNDEKLATYFYSDKYEGNNIPQPQPTTTSYDITQYNQTTQSTSVTLTPNDNDILITIPYLMDKIIIHRVRTGVSTLEVVIPIEDCYYKIFKSADIPYDVPEPINSIYSQIIEFKPLLNYTKLIISTEYVQFIANEIKQINQ